MKINIIDTLEDLMQVVQELNEQTFNDVVDAQEEVTLDTSSKGLILNNEYLIPSEYITFEENGNSGIIKVFKDYNFLEINNVTDDIKNYFSEYRK